MSETATFIPTTQFKACYLNIDTPLGVFRPNVGGLMLIVQTEHLKGAIILEQMRGAAPFSFWELRDQARDWQGCAFGAVELEVDWGSIAPAGSEDAGDLILNKDGLHMLVLGSRSIDRYWVKVGETQAGAVTAPDSSFNSWRLVRRGHDGKTQVMFLRAADQ